MISPEIVGGLAIPLLSLFCPTTQKDDQDIALLAEIDTMAGVEVYPGFENTGAHALCVGEVALLHPDQLHHYLGHSVSVRLIELSSVGTAAFGVNSVQDFNHQYRVTDGPPWPSSKPRWLPGPHGLPAWRIPGSDLSKRTGCASEVHFQGDAPASLCVSQSCSRVSARSIIATVSNTET